jgi:hypothetical protein
MDHSLAWPLVDLSDEPARDPVVPASLGVSPELTLRLRRLAQRWDLLSRRWIHDRPVADVSRREEAEWARDQLEAAYDLQHELGDDVEVLVDRIPLTEARRLRAVR